MQKHRSQFAITNHKSYLNSCSYGALADSVNSAMQQYLNDRIEQGACWEKWVGMQENLRDSTAKLLNARSSEIAITTSLSAGLNALVSSFDFSAPQQRKKIICTSFDFPTTAHIWHAQEVRGAQIETVQIDGSNDPESLICNAIDDDTFVVSIPLVCYRHGRKLNPDSIIKKARQHGVKIVLDAYQGIGTIPFDVKKWDVDVLLGGYLKYLLGTAGCAYMYVKHDWCSALTPTTSGWFTQNDIHAMSIDGNHPASAAYKFEAGTPNVTALYACIAGLEIIHKVTPTAIETHVEQLTNDIKLHAERAGWRVASGSNPHGPMIAIGCRDMYELVELLGNENIVVSCRDDNIRISPHFFNNQHDIQQLLTALDKYADYLN